MYNEVDTRACRDYLRWCYTLKGKQNERSAYQQIVALCYKYGIISSPHMTEAELRVVLETLCASLSISCPEQAATECQRFEKENPK